MTATPTPQATTTGASLGSHNDQRNAHINIDSAAGRDVIKNYNLQDPNTFVKIEADDIDASFFDKQHTEVLVQNLKKEKVLLLSSDIVDTSSLGHHVAWKLKADLAQALPPEEGNVLMWYQITEIDRLEIELKNAKETNIFVIIRTDIRLFENTFLTKIQSSKHYLIISTNRILSNLTSFAQAKIYQPTLVPQSVYDIQKLEQLLLERIKHSSINKNDIPNTIFSQLNTPSSIRLFTDLIASEKTKPDTNRIQQLIDSAIDQKDSVRQWFYRVLSPREQLLALGLAFFDGLYAEQIFLAIDKIVEDVWKRRDSTLGSIDYGDLENLYFFDINDGTRFNSKFLEFRRMLFEIAFKTHKRQIILALPVLIQIINESVSSQVAKSWLYGTSDQRDLLRKTISETISDIGILSFDSVEESVLYLAQSPHVGIKAVAARTIAYWYIVGQDHLFFTAFDKWYSPSTTSIQLAEINATIALAIGYAIRDEQIGFLPKKLIDSFREIALDKTPLVKIYFDYQVLRMILPKHFVQLQVDLETLAYNNGLHISISEMMYITYRNYPTVTKKLIKKWHHSANSFENNTTPNGILSYNISMDLSIRSYIGIWFTSLNRGQNEKWIEQEIRILFSMKNSTRSMLTAIDALEFYLATHPGFFKYVVNVIRIIVLNVSQEHIARIIKLLTTVYLKQRTILSGGQTYMPVIGTRYPVWIDPAKRPLTDVEETMFLWLKDDRFSSIQRMTAQAFFQFAFQLEMDEYRWLDDEAKKLSANDSLIEEEQKNLLPPQSSMSFYIKNVIPFISTRNDRARYNTIKNLWPEIWARRQTHTDAVSFVVNRLKNTSARKDQDIYMIAKALEDALVLTKYESLFDKLVIISVILLIFVFLLGVYLAR